jgi:hypothetical protein
LSVPQAGFKAGSFRRAGSYAASYSALKMFFDTLNKQDNHTVMLKQGAATASN